MTPAGRLARFKRRVDRRFHRALFRAYRLLFPARVPPGPARPADVRRVLVVRHDAIGDLVVTTPALTYLRATLPHAEIDVLASSRNAGLLRGDPRVDRVYVNDHRWRAWPALRRTLRARRYDVVLSVVLGRHLREGLVAAAVAHPGARRVTAARRPQYAGLWTHWVRTPRGRRHMADRLLYLAQSAVGGAPRGGAPDAPPRDGRLTLAGAADAEARVAAWCAEHAPGPFVALNAWATDAWRTLGTSYSADLAARLAAAHPGLRVVLTPPPGAAARAEAIVRAARAALDGAALDGAAGARLLVFPPAPSLGDLLALLRRAAVVVTPDTANVHLAAAAGTPVVGLYTARTTDPAEWRPYGVPHRTLDAPGGGTLDEIPAARVAEAAGALLAEARAGAAAAGAA